MKIRKQIPTATVTRRGVMIGSASLAFLAAVAIHAADNPTKSDGDSINQHQGDHSMNKVRTKDGVDIFYKD